MRNTLCLNPRAKAIFTPSKKHRETPQVISNRISFSECLTHSIELLSGREDRAEMSASSIFEHTQNSLAIVAQNFLLFC
jgi:hypothetical protein